MRHTRQDVLERTEREFERFDRLISSLAPADWAKPVPRPETRDPWTVKDTVAHIVYWKLHTARVIRGERRPAEMRGLDVPRINALIYQQWRNRSPDEVLAWHREVQEDVLRTLREKPEEWFGRREHQEGWPGDFDGHSAAHRVRDIEAALVG
jgi:uncharacterized damage-inducible protein DinB